MVQETMRQQISKTSICYSLGLQCKKSRVKKSQNVEYVDFTMTPIIEATEASILSKTNSMAWVEIDR